jgi:hypothetical protein
MPNRTIRPGQIVDRSGIYREPRTGETTTLVHGKVAPPTPQPKSYWQEIVDSHPRGPTYTGPRGKG